MKKVLLLVMLAALILSFSSAALADEAYVIKDYDVHIIVSQDNVLDVVERLTVDFSMDRHGIFYYRQFRGVKQNVVDGEIVDVPFWYNIKDIDVVGQKFEKSTYVYDADRYIELKIGDANKYVSGEQEYIITYKSEISDDGFEEFDEFYQDILYCEYGDTIENASFIIEFPKNIDENKVYAYLGEYFGDGSESVYIEADGDTIRGYTLRPMQGGEVLTVRAELEQGYFTGNKDPYAIWMIVLVGVSGACVLIAFLLWVAFGNDKKVFPTVEFYPPDDMTPAEAGYIIDGTTDDKDVISLLIYWADKGCLEIIEHSKDDIDLRRLKELPDNARRFEKNLFAALFVKGDTVSISSLKYTFYPKMLAAKTGVTNFFESSDKRRVFTKKSKKARGLMGLLTMLPIALGMFMFVYFSTAEFWTAAFVVAATCAAISIPVFMLVRLLERWRSTERGKKIAKLIFSFILLGVVFLIYIIGMPIIFDTIKQEFSILVTQVSAVSTLLMMWLTAIMRKRTDQGSSWYGKLLGFKEFIEKAEKDRILRLVEENPSYFYSVLPYAYVLGVTNKWAKKFEDINVEQPGWYRGYSPMNMFTTMYFVNSISRNMSQIQNVATSKPSSGGGSSGGFSGGGFSGGGFSGGGGGGGGAGGSW